MCLCVLLCDVVCVVIIVVVVLLFASALASMRWLSCGEKMRVQKKTTAVIVDKLPRREFISITVLINSKISSAINYGYYGFN